MQLTRVSQLVPGQILGQPLYDDHSQVLVKKGTRLTSYIINRLIAMDYHFIYIYAEDNDYELNDVVNPELRQKMVTQLRRLASGLSYDSDGTLNTMTNQQTAANLLQLRSGVAEIVDDIFLKPDIVVEMMDIKHVNSALFQHSVNTMIHATILGSAAGLSRPALEKLALGALFHDIGHLQTPSEILSKQDPLTPEELSIAQAHTIKGFAFLTTQLNMPSTVKIMALEHHEKFDGTGYPHQKSGEEIHQFSRITAIANRFDSLSSERPYRKPETLSECLEYIMGGGGSHFDPALTKIYMKHVNPYPVNTLVKLNDGSVATVVETNRNFFLRPKVKILKGSDRGEIIDLMKSLNRVILTDLTMAAIS
ncbi:HD-GYP domain-containing protein [Anoxynatronum buryatiense]|uniref:HD domain-containing protein n=1 Tax=Anoxynatronum buryatiense TaxID=489973 RepID=A0AA45WYU0_9CLOT|nr:HD-GYP domain-containing protein [Anoxynatronum buryatiense]SMP70454.1 HD domain-containing protein [Anoxynatronum buryatiense]